MQAQSLPRSVVLVLGCHRSGTSLITKCLQALDIELSENLMPARSDNPTGFWEDADIVAFNERLLRNYYSEWDLVNVEQIAGLADSCSEQWFLEAKALIANNYGQSTSFAIKDPRMCLLLPFWLEVFGELDIEVKCLVVTRSPLAVAASLQKRNGFATDKSLLLWLIYALNLVNSFPGNLAHVAVTDYAAFLDDPEPQIERINQLLALHEDLSGYRDEIGDFCANFLQTDLNHNTESINELPADIPLSAEIRAMACFLDDLAMLSAAKFPARPFAESSSLSINTRLINEQLASFNQQGQFETIVALRTELDQFTDVEADIARLKNEILAKDAEFEREQQKLQDLIADKEERFESELARLSKETIRKEQGFEKQIAQMLSELEEKESSYQQELARLLSDYDDTRERYETEIQRSLEELAAKDKGYKKEINRLDKEHATVVSVFENNIQETTKQVEQVQAELIQTLDNLAEIKEEKTRVSRQLNEHQHQLARQREEIQQLTALTQSYSFKLGRFLTWPVRKPFVSLILPLIRNRETVSLALRLAGESIRHPVRFLKLLNPGRIANVFHLIYRKPELGVQVFGNYTQQLQAPDATALPEVTRPPGDPAAIVKDLAFDSPEDPLVSVIIPVFNQLEYTLGCLRSITENKPQCSFEVIVADDGSSDETNHWLPQIEGLIYILNPRNLGFLRSCNNAVDTARGKYVFLLNNDTRVTDGWLDSLVSVFNNKQDVGLVGSRLIYPDGKLQEAGGIVWQDASGWNYGRLDDPEKPEFNYLKEVDYVSGAAMLFPRQLFLELGKFDERYAPAYYEDTDLAFKVRSKGLKVFMQPRSNIVHFEGISNGTDLSEGIKKHQAINQQQFRTKWQETLDRDHFPNAEKVFLARDRAQTKKTVLVIDHYVPHFDRDAGSRSTWQYLNLLVDLGFSVKFIGDNFFKHEPYTAALENIGVEVLHGNYYAQNWQHWLQQNAADIAVIYLHRPHISEKYIKVINALPVKPKTIYFGHDLHFMRLERQFDIEKDSAIETEAQDWKRREFEIFNQVDLVYFPSEVEVNRILQEQPLCNVKAIPLYMFEEQNTDEFVPGTRENLLFIGGFNHKPNVDAIHWFVTEVWPQVVAELPDVKLHVVGSNMPASVNNLADRNVLIRGYLSDADVDDLYRQVRLSVVPLRYGAGIKGKVLESMHKGIPVITTAIGAEGIFGVENGLKIASENDFARDLIALYQDHAGLSSISSKGKEIITQYYSIDAAMDAIRSDFNNG